MARRRRQIVQPDLGSAGAKWKRTTFDIADIASDNGIARVEGFEYAGMGLKLESTSKARYVRKDGTRREYRTWSAVHLNTGHRVRTFFDQEHEAMMAAVNALAEMTDWTFDGLQGWRNIDPELPDKMQVWHKRFGLKAKGSGGGANDSVARAIGMSRL